MPNPKTEIRFSIETIEDMMFNNHIYEYFGFLAKLIEDGFSLSFYRDDEKYTEIKYLIHLNNFKKSFKFLK